MPCIYSPFRCFVVVLFQSCFIVFGEVAAVKSKFWTEKHTNLSDAYMYIYFIELKWAEFILEKKDIGIHAADKSSHFFFASYFYFYLMKCWFVTYIICMCFLGGCFFQRLLIFSFVRNFFCLLLYVTCNRLIHMLGCLLLLFSVWHIAGL